MNRRVLFVSFLSLATLAVIAGLGSATGRGGAQAAGGVSEPRLSAFLLPEDRFNLPERFRSAREDAGESDASRFQPNQTDDDGPRMPKIDRVRPREVVANGPEFRLRLTGEDFRNGSRVTLNGTPYRTFFVNSRNLFVNVPVELTRNPGTIAVTVVDPRQRPVNTVNMTVTAESDAVTVAGLQPSIVVEEQSDFAIRIFGTGFRRAGREVDPVIRVGGERVDSEVRRSGEFNEVVAAVSVRDVGVSGTVPIQVEVGDTLSKVFNLIVSAPGPSIESLDPGRADAGSKDTAVKIAGQNFNEDSRVLINGTPIATKFNSFIELEATIPEALLKDVRQLELVVDNPNESVSDTRLFSVVGDDPVIFSISPNRLPAGEGNFNLIINGANLNRRDTKVLIGGRSVEFTDPTGREITIDASRDFVRTSGRVPIVVQTGGKDSNTVELIVEAPDMITTVAGRNPGYRDGSSTQALFARPSRAAVGPDGLVYVCDQLNHSIRTVNPNTGDVRTFIGDGFEGYVDTLDIDLADSDKDNDTVRFSNPLGIAIDRDGTIYVSDYGNDVIRRIRRTAQGRLDVDTYAGQNRKVFNEEIGKRERIGQPGYQDGPVVSARFSGPDGIKVGPDGKLYVADAFNNLVRIITPSPEGIRGTVVSSLFGPNLNPGNVDGIAPNVRFNTPLGLDFQGQTLLVADFGNNRVRAIDLGASDLVCRTLTGIAGGGERDGFRQVAQLSGPLAVTVDGNQVYVVDNSGNRIRKVESTGEVSTIAGAGADFQDGPGPRARFRAPRDIIRLSDTDLIVIDSGNHRIRKIAL